MGQAFCDLLERLDPTSLPDHGGASTRVVVTIPLGDLLHGLGLGTLGDGTRITADEARRLACTAGILPAVLGGGSEVAGLHRSGRVASVDAGAVISALPEHWHVSAVRHRARPDRLVLCLPPGDLDAGTAWIATTAGG